MDEVLYGGILERLDKEFPARVHRQTLEKEKYNLNLLEELEKEGYIEKWHKSSPISSPSQEFIITTKGTAFLTLIRIKNANEELNSSIKKFTETSSEQGKKLIELIERLHIAIVNFDVKASEQGRAMIKFTKDLKKLTIILAVLAYIATIPLLKDYPLALLFMTLVLGIIFIVINHDNNPATEE